MTELNFNEIAIFSGDELVPMVVKMYDKDDPVEGTVYIKRLPSVEIDRFIAESNAPEIETRVNAVPRLLNKAVRKADGKAHFTSEKAGTLTNINRTELLRVVMHVNKKVDKDELGNA